MDKDVENFLEHYGVPGMKWGVRKQRSGKIAARATVNRRGRKDQVWVLTAKQLKYGKVYRKAAGKIRKGTRQLNKDERFAEADFTKDSPLRKTYYNEYSSMVTKQLNAAATLSRHGTSPRGKYEMYFTFDTNKDARPAAHIRMRDTRKDRKVAKAEARNVRKFRHADVDDPDLPVELIYDAKGFIVDSKVEGMNDLEHAEVDNFLEHYGVKGMRWGIRKDPSTGRSALGSAVRSVGGNAKKVAAKVSAARARAKEKKEAEASAPKKKTSTRSSSSTNTKLLSDQELRERIQRLEMERRYADLMKPSPKQKSMIQGVLQDAARETMKDVSKNLMGMAVGAGLSAATKGKIQYKPGGKKK